MRLSNIRGEKSLDVIADLLGPVANIASDEAASALFRKVPVSSKENAKSEVFAYWAKRAPALIKRRKGDLVEILAILSDTTVEQYTEALTPLSLVHDVIDLLTDPMILDLFGSAQTSGGGEPSGSAPENTGDAVQED